MEILLFFFTRSHEEDDKEDEAVKCYESILNIDPDHKDAKRSIDRIKGLEKDLEELGFKDVDYKFAQFSHPYLFFTVFLHVLIYNIFFLFYFFIYPDP